MTEAVYCVSGAFFKRLFVEEQGVEPLLIADRYPRNSPQRIFLVRYVIGEGGGGENSRPVFKEELTGYDYEAGLTYPTQRVQLGELHSSLELSMYGSPEAEMARAQVENEATKERKPIKAIVSEALAARLVHLYRFSW